VTEVTVRLDERDAEAFREGAAFRGELAARLAEAIVSRLTIEVSVTFKDEEGETT
jgi:hypothetical protein